MTQDDINRQKGKDGNVGKAFDIKAGREAADFEPLWRESKGNEVNIPFKLEVG